MSLTVTTRASTDVSTTDGTGETVDSYSTEQSVSISVAPDPSDVAMELGGEATAVGDDTLALGSMDASVDGTGSVTSAYGSATFIAAAESEGGETAFATADSYGFLSGMDFLVVFTNDTQIIQEGPDGSLWISTSETTLYGMDFDAFSTDGTVDADTGSTPLAEGEEMATASVLATDDFASSESEAGDFEASDPLASDLLGSAADPFDDEGIDIEGNVAFLDIDADVSGPDTLLLVEADVLTIEDALSTVIADLVAAIG
jgi:hypothetical protein